MMTAVCRFVWILIFVFVSSQPSGVQALELGRDAPGPWGRAEAFGVDGLIGMLAEGGESEDIILQGVLDECLMIVLSIMGDSVPPDMLRLLGGEQEWGADNQWRLIANPAANVRVLNGAGLGAGRASLPTRPTSIPMDPFVTEDVPPSDSAPGPEPTLPCSLSAEDDRPCPSVGG